MTRPYLLEWDSIPYPPKFKPLTLHLYDCKNSPNQHIYYFWSQTGNVIDNDAIMITLFIGTLKGVAFDWFRSLPKGSINSWLDLKTRFLSRFYEDVTEVIMDKLLSTVKKKKRVCKRHRRACLYPCYFRHVGITSTTKWKSAWEPSRPTLGKSLSNKPK